jgi:glucose/arabinose dehydrogenase
VSALQCSDELNMMVRGENYGYSLVSQGGHYFGASIPRHESNPSFQLSRLLVNGNKPAGLMICRDNKFADWTGDGFVGGWSFKEIVRVSLY